MGLMKIFNEILNMEEVTGIWMVPIWRDNPYDYTKEKNHDEMVINILIKDEVSSEYLVGELWGDLTNKIMEFVENSDLEIPVIVLNRNKSGIMETLCENKDMVMEWTDQVRKKELEYKKRRESLKVD